ncbi:pentapeptide repeat-containing protein, partial [Streptomyces sp. NPDC047014]|uniref:pentapeptide repeat-containing protein n=1 Tax=Streptomyces sp. NPDC047014 TaxID=3155736 RepID=UPI0033E611EA
GGADGAEPAVQLFPAVRRGPAGTPAEGPGGRRGTPLRLPRAASLDDPLALMRSLRPVGRRSIGGPGEDLDEQLTVERSIERMVLTPVLRPAESRWLDLALVVDTHPSMLLWADLVDELRGALTRSGVFRDVRTWQLTGTGPGATPMLTRGRGGPPRNPLELADPAGRRLILVLSDTVAGGWREAPVQGVLRHWCAHNAVAVLNVLPERLWTRGAVRPAPYTVRADRPAAATRSWQRGPAAGTARGGRRRRAADLVPVVGTSPGSLARLVRVVSGDGRWRRLACLRLDARPGEESPPPGARPEAGGRSALEVVERFRASASPTAQQLAAHLAAVPLTLPVMTLVRRSLLRGSEHGHLAEVALGGLFEPWGEDRDRSGPEDAEFAFLPGVREVLLGSQLRGDVAAVRELVRRRVWEYMSRNRGPGPDFPAVRVTDGREGRRQVPEEELPFAARPAPEIPPGPGLRDRVVRVRSLGMPEQLEVGVLLTPRLVLTVGDASPASIGWVLAGDPGVACHAVWWDDALPRVYLLLAGEDLDGPDLRLDPLPWLTAELPPDRVRIDGRTDEGVPVALTAEAAPASGDRNGELVRLSAEPEPWTHFRGGPVSYEGRLAGIVHGVWPDRMVFLSARALLEQPGFRAALEEHTRTGDAAPPDGAGTTVCLAVRRGDDGRYPAGSSPDDEVRGLLRSLTQAEGIAEPWTGGGAAEPSYLVLEAPGALGAVGRLLSALPEAVDRYPGGMRPSLEVGVAVGSGPEGAVSEAVRITRHLGIVDRNRRPPGPLVLGLSQPLSGELRTRLGPSTGRSCTLLGLEGEGWMWADDPAELGHALTEAEECPPPRVDWQTCDLHATGRASGRCIGIRLPGHRRCLAHLGPEEREAYLGTLEPEAPVDLRGTTFAGGLLRQVFQALRAGGEIRAGRADFGHAVFTDPWNVDSVFTGPASFDRAVFAGRALFDRASFAGPASFAHVSFDSRTTFEVSHFDAAASFRGAFFRHATAFTYARFRDGLDLTRAVFQAPAELNGIRVTGTADLTRAYFHRSLALNGSHFAGDAVFARTTWGGELRAAGASFDGPVTFDRARFRGGVLLEGVTFPPRRVPFQEVAGRSSVRARPGGTWDVEVRPP